jgi:hypothetical protein
MVLCGTRSDGYMEDAQGIWGACPEIWEPLWASAAIFADLFLTCSDMKAAVMALHRVSVRCYWSLWTTVYSNASGPAQLSSLAHRRSGTEGAKTFFYSKTQASCVGRI